MCWVIERRQTLILVQDGSTIHSYSGIGYGEDSKEVLADRINKKARHKKRWGKTKVLVIDEISMLSGMKH